MNFEYQKAVQAICFFAQKEGGSIDKMKLVKLIWLSDRLHLRTYGRAITKDTYYAMERGPVPSCTKDFIENSSFLDETETLYRSKFIDKRGNNTVVAITDPDLKMFSKSDIEIMDRIYNIYGKYTQFNLSDFSHYFPEWKRHEALLKGGGKRGMIHIEDFFENVNSETSFENMNESEGKLAIAKEMFFDLQIVK